MVNIRKDLRQNISKQIQLNRPVHHPKKYDREYCSPSFINLSIENTFHGEHLPFTIIAGHFFVRSTDLLSLPNVNPDSAFGMQVNQHETEDMYKYLWIALKVFQYIYLGFDRRGPQRLTGGECINVEQTTN